MPVTATLRKAGQKPAPEPTASAPAPTTAGKRSLASQLAPATTPAEEGQAAAKAAELETDTAEGSRAMAAVTGGGAAAKRDAYADANDGFDRDDIKLATLKIVAGSGPLSLKFNVGSLILGEESLFDPPNLREGAANPVLRFIPLAMKKQWRETVTEEDYANGVLPRIANSVEEVAQLGGTTQWVNGQKPSWGKSAKCVFLVEEPEGTEHGGFNIQIGEKKHALAVFYAAGMSYRESAQVIFNAAQMWPRDPKTNRLMWHKRVWSMRVGKKTSGTFSVWVPILQLTKEDTGAEVNDLALQMNGVNVEAAE